MRWFVHDDAAGATCCRATFDAVYRYAATLCGDDRSATESLVSEAYHDEFARARGNSGVVSLDDLLSATRWAMLRRLNAEHGEGRRLHLVAAASDHEAPPREGFDAELVHHIETGWRGAPLMGDGHRTRLLAIAVVAVSMITAIAIGARGIDHPVARAATTTVATATTPQVVTPGSPADTVSNYFAALSQGRYADAAVLLRGGPALLDRRADLRPIFPQLNDVGAALAAWCARGALCRPPSELVDEGGSVRVKFHIEDTDIYQTFTAGTYQGAPFVRGLPMIVPTPLRRDAPYGLALVLCPTANVVSVTTADLNGDGWFEQIVLQRNGRSPGWSVTVCGTYLNTPLRPLPPLAEVRIYPVNVTGRGADVLLVGDLDASARFRGNVWTFDPGKGGASRSERNFDVSPIAGSNIGCLDVNGDSVPDLVQLDFHYVGGTDINTSTAVDYTATAVWPNDVRGTISGHVGLLPRGTTLPPSLAGNCGDRPIVTS